MTTLLCKIHAEIFLRKQTPEVTLVQNDVTGNFTLQCPPQAQRSLITHTGSCFKTLS